MEKTLVIIKPDAIQRALVGEIISRLEKKGLQLVATKMVKMSGDMVNQHYSHIKKIPTYPDLKQFMSSEPLLAMCWQGLEVINTVRKLCGQTKSRDAEPGTIRGDFGMSIQRNLIHASDSIETAKKEINQFFDRNEIFEYSQKNFNSIYSRFEQEQLRKS
ncbi:MAG: nucleoside-diphosphate kinase [Candidatus Electrothrix communis]|nr:MAG: nucleoside-diphosphate kinase [Candidatus Electrothrix communis]